MTNLWSFAELDYSRQTDKSQTAVGQQRHAEIKAAPSVALKQAATAPEVTGSDTSAANLGPLRPRELLTRFTSTGTKDADKAAAQLEQSEFLNNYLRNHPERFSPAELTVTAVRRAPLRAFPRLLSAQGRWWPQLSGQK